MSFPLLFGHQSLLLFQLCLFFESGLAFFSLKSKFLLNLNLLLLLLFDAGLLAQLIAFLMFKPGLLCLKFLLIFILFQLAFGFFDKPVALLLLFDL